MRLRNIIPGLPDEVAMHILAFLPRSLYRVLGLVCHSWRNALVPEGPVMALRRRLNISDTWVVFVSVEGGHVRFLFVDPACRACLSTGDLLLPIFQAPNLWRRFSRVRPPVAVRSDILIPQASVRTHDCTMLYCFDAQTMQWKAPACLCRPGALMTDAFVYASAAIDEYVYLAGGLSSSSERMTYLKTAEKLDIRTRTWEALPDMQQERMDAHAVFLQGRLCIIGGHSEAESLHSGEIWDPISRKWTLMRELWPASVFGKHMYTSCVTSVKGTLYALRCIKLEDVQELMYYEDASKLWISVGKFCFPALVEREHGAFSLCKKEQGHYQMVGTDEELLVICRAEPPVGRNCMKDFTFIAVLSMKPTLSQPITWKIWPLNYPVNDVNETLILHV